MSNLLVIDPGTSTGMAYFEDGTARWSLTSSPPHAEVSQRIKSLQEAIPTLEVVCEEGPVNRLQAETCAPVEHIVREEAIIIHWVRPSDWKPHPSARIGEGDIKPKTRHERDVLRIGRWFLTTRANQLVHSAAA